MTKTGPNDQPTLIHTVEPSAGPVVTCDQHEDRSVVAGRRGLAGPAGRLHHGGGCHGETAGGCHADRRLPGGLLV